MAFPAGYSPLDTDIVDSTDMDNVDAGKDHATAHNEVHGALNDLATQATTDEAYHATNWNGSLEFPTKNAVRDKIEDILDGVTFTGDVVVPDEAYDATAWNGSLEVPTKNAIRDKIETMGAGGGSVSDTAYGSSWNGDTTVAPSKNAVYDAFVPLAGLKVVRKTANESVTSNATPQADDELTFAIAANEVWVVDYYLAYTSASAADLQVGLALPASATARMHFLTLPSDVTDVNDSDVRLSANTGSSIGVGSDGTNTAHAQLHAVVVNSSNAGNVDLMWAQLVSTGSATTVLANSYMVAHRVPLA